MKGVILSVGPWKNSTRYTGMYKSILVKAFDGNTTYSWYPSDSIATTKDLIPYLEPQIILDGLQIHSNGKTINNIKGIRIIGRVNDV